MSEPKTRPTDVDPRVFVETQAPERHRADSLVLIDMLADVTGEPPVMWGDAIVGFGQYTYVNSSKKPQTWPLIGFSPRKGDITLYIMPGFDGLAEPLSRLGKHTTARSCLYIKRLADIDRDVLRDILAYGYATTKARHPN
ncbi:MULTISPECIES: DUF1801 domain-containing protein [Asticcacaulis]|uniref:DUF1801 domain-containing protein n=1 Tax=Asticcacaulis TaxID=76890 RepID=UPI001AE7C38B|nr:MULTISPECIES: DUF1801 domain-containing protein [Asticcacaulis]MBP2158586.1 hypothetical protein [Asticcacaulis solisilvae]MDR6799632.1 hypothetical protein [Asticcacaulis sp. BE141]